MADPESVEPAPGMTVRQALDEVKTMLPRMYDTKRALAVLEAARDFGEAFPDILGDWATVEQRVAWCVLQAAQRGSP